MYLKYSGIILCNYYISFQGLLPKYFKMNQFQELDHHYLKEVLVLAN